MKIVFLDQDYQELYLGKTRLGFSFEIIKAYQKKIQMIYYASSMEDLYKATSLHCEKLKGDRKGRYSIRINIQWRLIFKLLENGTFQVVGIKGIEDYH